MNALPSCLPLHRTQIKPDDAFGRQMCSNLESRGCPIRGVSATPTLQAHMGRFTGNGWGRAAALDMDTIYQVGGALGHRPLTWRF